jgi:hypothetical protein
MTTFAERPTIAAPRQGVQKTSWGSQFVKTITSTSQAHHILVPSIAAQG